ncbi:hypothetical protein PR048_011998 [Dryococelus australis]|uniref:Uncharacterized protein n=1 Tax=Dryococelus australis TaxID=614101 RepID=A0ABQ9HN64_9NEOP|nr:hypothetical protein PR048_011998 [Dryococelus australis]
MQLSSKLELMEHTAKLGENTLYPGGRNKLTNGCGLPDGRGFVPIDDVAPCDNIRPSGTRLIKPIEIGGGRREVSNKPMEGLSHGGGGRTAASNQPMGSIGHQCQGHRSWSGSTTSKMVDRNVTTWRPAGFGSDDLVPKSAKGSVVIYPLAEKGEDVCRNARGKNVSIANHHSTLLLSNMSLIFTKSPLLAQANKILHATTEKAIHGYYNKLIQLSNCAWKP